MKSWRFGVLSACLLASSVLAEPATFDTGTGVLTIPELALGADTFRNVRFQLGADGKLSFLGFQPAVAATCTLEHINFTKYRSLPPFYTIVTTSQLDDIIGCKGVLTSGSNNTSTYTWTLATSTATCKQYIYVELMPAPNNQIQTLGWGIVGINSDTNLPKPCSN